MNLDLANEYGFSFWKMDYDYDFHYDKSAVLPWQVQIPRNGI
ncbi:hypothetical protein QW060_25255 [Myroides ceti]|uniref:Uncharacterized protein n=1 Tax=Paenimyroides ceti TaxID=395087 RepID=A0ABT8D4N8_9FLAO|nr:hypothetical protein [Paenimyroides ceti]MDN3710184.1 hypothetical protein [Paenimyroides ceti]